MKVFLFVDSPNMMSQFDIEEYQNTAMSEVAAQNYLLSDQEECMELQDKQDKLLGTPKAMDFVIPKHEVELIRKVVPEATRTHVSVSSRTLYLRVSPISTGD